MALLKYHYGFSLEELYGLSISQYRSYLDNLGFVLGQEKDDSPKTIYNPATDVRTHPELMNEFDKALGVKVV